MGLWLGLPLCGVVSQCFPSVSLLVLAKFSLREAAKCMVKIHEVFSTSITLDEVERANQEASAKATPAISASANGGVATFGGCDAAQRAPVRLCHASTILPLRHDRDHHAFIPFSPMLCAFYAGSDQGMADTSIYVVHIGADGCHSLVQKVDCPQRNQKANCTPVLFYLNQGAEAQALREKEGKSHIEVQPGNFKTTVNDMVALAKEKAEDMNMSPSEIRGNGSDVIALIYKAARVSDQSVSYLSLSFNDGAHFMKPQRLVECSPSHSRGPVRTKPFMIRKGPYAGRVLFPSSVDSDESVAFADYTDDNLRTLTQSNEITPNVQQKEKADAAKLSFVKGVVQATLYEDLTAHATPGSQMEQLSPEEQDKRYSIVHMLMSASGAQVYQADSYDAGASWGEPYPLPLLNCNAAIDAVTYKNHLICCGRLIACDSVEEVSSIDASKSAPLALYISDDGHHFKELLCLEDDVNGIFTSPYLQIDRRHNLLYISYTDHRKAIKIRIFRLMQD